MNHKRGNLLVTVGLIILALLALAALIKLVTGYLSDLDQRGYDRGALKTKSDYEARDNVALVAANKLITDLNEKIRSQEKDHSNRVAKIDEEKTKEVKDVKAKADRDVARIRAGALKLRDPGRTEQRCPDGGGSSGGTTVAASGVGDGKAGAELSREAAAFLRGEAGRADAVVVQLTTAQALLGEAQRLCNRQPR